MRNAHETPLITADWSGQPADQEGPFEHRVPTDAFQIPECPIPDQGRGCLCQSQQTDLVRYPFLRSATVIVVALGAAAGGTVALASLSAPSTGTSPAVAQEPGGAAARRTTRCARSRGCRRWSHCRTCVARTARRRRSVAGRRRTSADGSPRRSLPLRSASQAGRGARAMVARSNASHAGEPSAYSSRSWNARTRTWTVSRRISPGMRGARSCTSGTRRCTCPWSCCFRVSSSAPVGRRGAHSTESYAVRIVSASSGSSVFFMSRRENTVRSVRKAFPNAVVG